MPRDLVNEEESSKETSVSKTYENMTNDSLEDQLFESTFELDKKSLNLNEKESTEPQFNEKEFRKLSEETIEQKIGSENHKKFIVPLNEKRERVSFFINRLMFFSLTLTASSLIAGIIYEIENTQNISEAKKLELSIQKNKVSQAEKPFIKRQIATLQKKSKTNQKKAVLFGRHITSGFALLTFLSMINLSMHSYISGKKIKKKAWEIYQKQEHTKE